MNLSAKEFVAALDLDDPGVLILFTICRRCGGTRQGFDRQSA
jgi:hypothetical protein